MNESENYFYNVEDNGHGFYQTFQVAEGDHFPVCSCCHAMVMINRGQGSACESCQHEAYMEACHDYDEGYM